MNNDLGKDAINFENIDIDTQRRKLRDLNNSITSVLMAQITIPTLIEWKNIIEQKIRKLHMVEMTNLSQEIDNFLYENDDTLFFYENETSHFHFQAYSFQSRDKNIFHITDLIRSGYVTDGSLDNIFFIMSNWLVKIDIFIKSYAEKYGINYETFPRWLKENKLNLLIGDISMYPATYFSNINVLICTHLVTPDGKKVSSVERPTFSPLEGHGFTIEKSVKDLIDKIRKNGIFIP